jgi:hypothetical protein
MEIQVALMVLSREELARQGGGDLSLTPLAVHRTPQREEGGICERGEEVGSEIIDTESVSTRERDYCG